MTTSLPVLMGEGFMPDHAYFSSGEITSSPYYQEFLIPRGFGWNATAALEGSLMIGLRRSLKRAQRLKSVFEKTRTSRQGELIVLLAKLGDRRLT